MLIKDLPPIFAVNTEEEEEEEKRIKEVVGSCMLLVIRHIKGFTNSQEPLMKLLARPEPCCAGEIIRVYSFSTHTYCNNQEHSVLSNQRAAIAFQWPLNIQQSTALIFS